MSEIFKYEQKIPKNIFQTWETKDVPTPMEEAMKTLQDLNPEYQWSFHDKDDRRKLILENFSPSVLMAYDSLVPGAYKADLWRLCVLYVNGGVYADCKQIHLIPLREYVKPDCDFFICNDRWNELLYQGFMGSIAGSEILEHLINKIVYNVLVNFYGECEVHITGPAMVGQTLNTLMGRKITQRFQRGEYTVLGQNMSIPLEFIDGENELDIVDVKNRVAFLRHYPTYYVNDNVNGYAYYWKQRNVFLNKPDIDLELIKKSNRSPIGFYPPRFLINFSPPLYSSFFYPKITVIDNHTVKLQCKNIDKYIRKNIKIIISHKNEKITVTNPRPEEVLKFSSLIYV